MACRAVAVRGVVQGVGFRPFVYELASELALSGFVRNEGGAVYIEIEGDVRQLDRFCDDLTHRAPPLAVIQDVSISPRKPSGERGFRIETSSCESAGPIYISPDVATCEVCLAELSNPADRRYGYPFLNCTNCGPRLTIIRAAPYDRAQTTMVEFEMCPDCRAEFHDPKNRRFHAQPTACSHCGPALQLTDNRGRRTESSGPVASFVQRLRDGKIGALKGLGGYHLVCDARNENTVCELRRRKQRDEKPFAVMVLDAQLARRFVLCDSAEEELLCSSARPIVVLRTRDAEHGDGSNRLAPSVNPRNPYVGIFLPYTPLHFLLLSEAKDIPLVMTSGNRSDEPIAFDDDDALKRLGDIADVFLTHNRPIHVRCDDSVARIIDGVPALIRRSRGYAPRPIKIPLSCDRQILAVGGQFKATFALGRDDLALVSHHMGDLDQFEAYRAFERDEHLYEELFDIHPELIVHDLHPDYASTRYALNRAAKNDVPTLAAQHHHAHVASCMAEHQLNQKVIGVAFDGTGFGTDGTIWGGEFLLADYCGFRRAAHLRPVQLPGGDRAIREPWRSAAAHLIDGGCDLALVSRFASESALRTVTQMISRRLNCVPTSSAGRLFDAVTALAGVRGRVSYEGQAAMELEWMTNGLGPDAPYPFVIEENAFPQVIDTRPLIRAVIEDVTNGLEPRHIARRFHSTIVEMIATVCGRIREHSGVETVVQSGGVFMNAVVCTETSARLRADGFAVYSHNQVPTNDGGLSLGQLAIASAMLHSSRVEVRQRAESVSA